MRVPTLLTACLLTAALLAGCSGSGTTSSTSAAPTTGSAAPTATPSTTPSASTTSAPPSSSPSEPAGTIQLKADKVSGTAPLQVNLTVTASGAAPTSFTLAFGDGQAKSGTTLPATFAHGYAAGSYTAKATATYANGKTAESTVSLAAVAAPAAAHGPLYNKTLSATLPFSWTGGVATDIALCGSPVPGGDAVSCPDQQLLTAYQKGLNKTFLLGTTITVPAGASTLAVDGGTDAKQTCQEVPEFGTLCTPDMDLWVFDPTGASTPFTTAADYEAGVIQAPAPGTWTIICHYFFGPPQQDMSLHVLIA